MNRKLCPVLARTADEKSPDKLYTYISLFNNKLSKRPVITCIPTTPLKWFSRRRSRLTEFHFGISSCLILNWYVSREASIRGPSEPSPIKSSRDTSRDCHRVKNTSWPILTTAFWRARVKRCHGAVSAWMFHEAASLLRGRSHTHVCVLVFAGRQSRNAHLNHCHLTDWPVSMALVKNKKKVPNSRNLGLFVPGRSFVCVYRGNGESEE